jgi:hypothetical protein
VDFQRGNPLSEAWDPILSSQTVARTNYHIEHGTVPEKFRSWTGPLPCFSWIFPNDMALESPFETEYFGRPVDPRAPGAVFCSTEIWQSE